MRQKANNYLRMNRYSNSTKPNKPYKKPTHLNCVKTLISSDFDLPVLPFFLYRMHILVRK